MDIKEVTAMARAALGEKASVIDGIDPNTFIIRSGMWVISPRDIRRLEKLGVCVTNIFSTGEHINLGIKI